jgi:hypothetical protein
MNYHNFINRVKALYNVDYYRLESVMPEHLWQPFRDNPVAFLLRCDDKLAAAIWAEVQHRAVKYDREEEVQP